MIASATGYKLDRGLALLLTAVPAGTGIVSFLNNVADWPGTIDRMVYPMLSMKDSTGTAAQTWRAIDSVAFANIAYGIVLILELAVGLIAAVALWRELRAFRGPFEAFGNGIALAMRACMFGIVVWGLFFFVIGGDWFLTWKNESLLWVQPDAMNYATLMFLVLGALFVLDREMRRAHAG